MKNVETYGYSWEIPSKSMEDLQDPKMEVVWNMNFIFHFIYGMSSFPIDELIFFNMVKTTKQIFYIPTG